MCQISRFEVSVRNVVLFHREINWSPLTESPELLLIHITGTTQESKHFLHIVQIRKYNAYFHLVSFGTTNIIKYDNLTNTFEVNRQHSKRNQQFLKIYTGRIRSALFKPYNIIFTKSYLGRNASWTSRTHRCWFLVIEG